MKLGRRAWGCDLNSEVYQWRPTIADYIHEPEIPDQQYDAEYPFYKFMEAGLTEDQFAKIVSHLLSNATASQLSDAPGIGPKKAEEFLSTLNRFERKAAITLLDYLEGDRVEDAA
jgi:hypothetical protein